jgi:CheY-like chemotaxis protein
MGYQVMTAKNGREALDIFRLNREQITLVILDMVMPELGGAETFTALREMDPKVKVILASGYSMEGQAMVAMEKGCNGFIQKPFGAESLADKIREIS